MNLHLDSGEVRAIPEDVFTKVRDLKLLGAGSFGEVYKYTHQDTDTDIAIKRIPLMTEKFPKEIERVRQEIDINAKLSHRHIVKYLGCHKGEDSICVVLEYMPKGTLKDKLNELEQQRGLSADAPLMTCDEIMHYSRGISSGLAFLHDKNVIHRDVRSPNVLITADDEPKIADFGMSKEFDVLTKKACFNTTQVGNTFWCAPEMMDEEEETMRDSRVDVWSMGVVILEMIHNNPPHMKNLTSYMKKVCVKNQGPDIPQYITEDMHKVLEMCFTFDVSERPFSKDVLQFIQSVHVVDRFHIFMSHNWGKDSANHNNVQIINEQLMKAGYCTWFDTDPGRMHGNVHAAMASGIENSRMALIFITAEYQDKVNGKAARGTTDNCYLEFHHCVRKLTQEKMICVVLDAEMLSDQKWEGVLGITMGGRIYVDMTGDLSDPQYIADKVAELKKNMDLILDGKTTAQGVSSLQSLQTAAEPATTSIAAPVEIQVAPPAAPPAAPLIPPPAAPPAPVVTPPAPQPHKSTNDRVRAEIKRFGRRIGGRR